MSSQTVSQRRPVRFGRPAWHVAEVAEARRETPNAVRLVLDVPTWPGSEPGTHLDVRLTAPDGYRATRSYSVAESASGRVVLAVEELPDGEVSPFLVHELRAGDVIEVHGPLGSYFRWRHDEPGRPVQLVAGGSGVVPLYAMARAHAAGCDPSPLRLLYSVRTPADVYFHAELSALAGPSFALDLVYTRRAPEGWPGTVGRLTREGLESRIIAAREQPRIFVCGSTSFVEAVTPWLQALGHPADNILTEQFGGL